MKTLRDLVSDAISMRRSGKPEDEIRAHLWKSASALGIIASTESANGEFYEIRLVQTGEIIACDAHGYSYRPR